jgi:diguanylate cyclase (GGDEF)-like protein/PAS domain S-box-containing protein
LVAGAYYGGLLATIASEVAKLGGRVIAIQALEHSDAGDHPDWTGSRRDYLDTAGCPPGLAWGQVSGLIGLTGGPNRAYLEDAMAAGVPVVLVSCDVPGVGCPVVRPDNHTGIAEAVRHLRVAHGRSRIAFVGDISREADIRERYAAYQAALRENGLEPDPALFFGATDNVGTGGRIAAAKILADGVPCDAVVAATDHNAIALMDSLTKAGVRIPEDVAIVGFDNTDEAALCSPPLTSVSRRLGEVARLAVDLMRQAAAGQPGGPGDHIVPNYFVLRRSCGCGAATDSQDPPEALEEIWGQLWRTLSDTGPSSSEAAQQLVGALAAHLEAATTEEEVAMLPGKVNDAARELLCGGADMAAGLVVARAARQVATFLRPRVAAAAAPGVTRLLEHLSAECTRVVLNHHAIEMSGGHEGSRDWFDISAELLRAGCDARTLQWLSGTEARAACLGLWSADARYGENSLEIVGTYNMPGTGHASAVVPCYAAEDFPPAQLAAQDDDPAHCITYLMPVRTDLRYWGVLAMLGPIWQRGTGSRDVYNEWSTLLSMALDHEQVLASLRQQRENFAQLYERQTALATAMQKSGERYALVSQATQDGLWDWQPTTEEVYYSRRFLELLGFNATVGSVLGKIEDWLNSVFDEDRPMLERKLHQLEDARGQERSFELEHRVTVGPGEVRWVLCKAISAKNSSGVTTRVVGSLTDITARKGLEQRLSYAALHDSLTGLANRTLVTERIREALDINQRDRARNFAVLWLDLDRFKVVNDSMGHRAGDALLKEVARRLTTSIRATDTAGRVGGDEFVVVVNPLPAQPEDLEKLVVRLQQQVAAPYLIDGHEANVSASVGVLKSTTTKYGRTEDVLRDADVAMYSAKQAERGSYAVFEPPMRKAVKGRLQAVTDLRHALARKELALHYQPVVELASGRTVGMEALVRWPHADGGVTAPSEFLPTAGEAGLMPQLGQFVLAEACAQQAVWERAGILPEAARVAINVSHEEFWHCGFLEGVDQAVAASGTKPLTIEITEGIIMNDLGAGLSILQELRRRGFKLHIDDFGTGRSSLEALRDLPVDALKIDRSFVVDLAMSPKSAALVRTVVRMAQALGLDVIAEGIETADEAHLLLEMGCPFGQGYWLARPMGAEPAAERLTYEAERTRAGHRH